MQEQKSKIEKLAHDLQYGTSEEAEDAVKELIGMKEEGEIPPGSSVEKLIENMEMRQRIEQQRENAVAREIAGEDEFGHFEKESHLDGEGVLIEHEATHGQITLRPAIKAYPDVMNNRHGLRAVGELVDRIVEEEGGDKDLYDDPNTYLQAAKGCMKCQREQTGLTMMLPVVRLSSNIAQPGANNSVRKMDNELD